ncbi:MAG: cupin domain-containing protein [Alphaproteobacteria bacterium]
MTGALRGIRQGTLLTFSLLALAVAPSVAAQDAKPQKTSGVSVGSNSTLPLGAQIPALKGYALRLRTIVLEPGAVVGYHSHARRPVAAYLLSGEYTEHRDGRAAIVHKPGEQWVEGADVAHWSENRGAGPVVLINVDVLPAK